MAILRFILVKRFVYQNIQFTFTYQSDSAAIKKRDMRNFKIEASGIVPNIINQYIMGYNDRESTKDNILSLDDDISFIVCDLRLAHGNLNKSDKSAWLCPTNGDNSFNVRISW